MRQKKTYVVVGAGQAGGQAVQTLLGDAADCRIVLIGAERFVPHERPMLSKDVLLGTEPFESTFMKPESFYADGGVELRLDTLVRGIDRAANRVVLDHEVISYDKLLLATGARVRRLEAPGGDLSGIHYLRTIDDALALRSNLRSGVSVVVVGGGFIGLEVAAAARVAGCDVVLLETQPALLNRVLAPEVGRFYEDLHRTRGVNVRTSVVVAGFGGDRRVREVRCTDGSVFPADIVVVGIGVRPNVELAIDAGLTVNNGIVVDEYGQTSDENVFAAGDVANHPNALLGRRLRLESWQNAQNQAVVAARAMNGSPQAYAEVPWFWSDQYGVNLQMVGAPERWDQITIRGDVPGMKFSAFYLASNVVVGMNAINSGKDIRLAKQFIAQRTPLDPRALADTTVPLKTLATA